MNDILGQGENQEYQNSWERLKSMKVALTDTGKATVGTAIAAPVVLEGFMHLSPNLGLGLGVGALLMSIMHGDKAFRVGRWIKDKIVEDNGLQEYSQNETETSPQSAGETHHLRQLVGHNITSNSDTWDEGWYGEDETLPMAMPATNSEMFTFSQVLAEGFAPSLQKIFLARLTDGTDVYVSAKDLCHVALAGLTGNGKSAIMRLIMAQLCKIGVSVLLLNRHYMRYDQSGGEDWSPFESYLEKSPMECAEYDAIKTYLEWMACTLLPQRIERARTGKSIGKPYFIVIDELPAIVAEIKEAPEYIARILREGRKYGIFLIVASQDFQVKTIGFDGGGVRKCFKTAFYVGGDVATAKALLNDNPNDKIPENDLGKGTIMLRCSATKQALVAKVPLVDNESLYRLLGPSTFFKHRASIPLVPLSKPVARENYSYASENAFDTEALPVQKPRVQAQDQGGEALRSTSVCTDAKNITSSQLPSTSDAEVMQMIVKRFKAGEKPYSICKSLGLPTSGQGLMDVSAMLKALAEEEQEGN